MNRKIFIIGAFSTVILIAGVLFLRAHMFTSEAKKSATTTTKVHFVSSTITTNGVITAQERAVMNFPAAGKLVYLPFKEGDLVSRGQTIAQLDTYQLQRQLTATLNTYRSARDTFDQTQQNSQDHVLRNQQATTFTRENLDNNTAINDAIKRILDQNQATLDNSVINVELANYALQLAQLTSPISGVITHEDVTVAGVNITPTATFVVQNPETMVFRANIPASNIYYVSEGSEVELAIDGVQGKIRGTIVRIYPAKVTLSSGQSVYQADVASDDLKKVAKLDQTGFAIIRTNAENVALIPAWTVLAGKYVWVDKNGTPELRPVTAGKIHGNDIEILGGLTQNDKVITNPEYIPARMYQLL